MGSVEGVAGRKQVGPRGQVGWRRTDRGMLIPLVIVAATAIGGAIHPARGAWTTAVVDDQQPLSAGIGVAVQPSGQVHLGYASGRITRYATNAYGSSPWTIEQVDAVPDSVTGLCSQIAIDAAGNMHMTYHDQYQHQVMYATNSPGVWTTPQVIEDNPAKIYSAVAIDSAGRAHILTIDSAGGLHYTTSPASAGGAWTRSPALPDGNVDSFPRIVVDSASHAHAAYLAGSNLRYATNAAGAWASHLVEANIPVDPESPIALAVDAGGHAHVAYADKSTDTLRYATNAANGTDWVAEKITDLGLAAKIASFITTDAQGKATVDFFDRDSGNLIRVCNASGSWLAGAPCVVPDTAADAAITTDLDSNVHLVYIDAASGNLKHLTDAAGPHGADVKVTQTHTPDTIVIGQTVQYTVTVTNLGTDGATGVVLTDTLPAGSVFLSATNGLPPDAQHPGQVRWSIGDLAKGATKVTTITVQAPAASGTMINKATVSSAADQDFKSANNDVSLTDPITVPKRPLVLSVTDDVGGTLRADNGQSQQDQGSTVSVTATPDPGYRVKNWQGTLDDSSTATTNTVLIGSGEKTTVQVQFERIQWLLTAMVVGGNGTLTPTAGQYDDGVTVTLVATPSRHYGVKKWTGTSSGESAGTTSTVLMDKNRTVTVEFQPVPNQAPIAQADLASVVYAGEEVTLDGSLSSDPDGDPLTYKWEEMDVKHVDLASATEAKATFTAPAVPKGQEMILGFRLTVTDDGGLPDFKEWTFKVLPTTPPKPHTGCPGPALGASNLLGFYFLCWLGLGCMKWGPRRWRGDR